MNLLAVTCMRDEGPYCLEWIAHHRAAGVTNFLIYTHDCDDGTDHLLDLIPGVTHERFDPIEGRSVQWRAMQLADQHPLMHAADWVIFFDCDEFLCLHQPQSTFQELIASVPSDTDAIALPWRLFGSAGHTKWHPGTTLERFRCAAPEPFHLPAGHFFKSLYRPEKFHKLGVHRPKNKGNTIPKWNLGGVQRATDTFAKDDKRINLFGLLGRPPAARLNHYSTRSACEFMIKRARGLPNRRTKSVDLSYWAERNFNTVADDTIQHMGAATRVEMDALFALAEVRGFVDSSIQTHHSRFGALMRDQRSITMYWHLTLLSGSAPPDLQDTSDHLSRLSQVQER